MCGLERVSVSGNAGTVTSPGYPGQYNHNADQCYVITLDQSGPQTVMVSVLYNLEYGDLCDYDYVEINADGYKYCDSGAVSFSFSVTGAQWFFRFHTDSTVTRDRGFSLEYGLA